MTHDRQALRTNAFEVFRTKWQLGAPPGRQQAPGVVLAAAQAGDVPAAISPKSP